MFAQTGGEGEGGGGAGVSGGVREYTIYAGRRATGTGSRTYDELSSASAQGAINNSLS